MKPSLRKGVVLLILSALIIIACKKDYSCKDCEVNKLPIANAGPDQLIALPKDSVVLDGRGSSDPGGKINEWQWTKISGPASYTITNSTADTTTVKNLTTGIYQFELKVTDNSGLSAKDTVQIVAYALGNQSPVAYAGTNQTVTLPTNTVTLDGSGSTDPDNNITQYLWTKINGPSSSNIGNATSMQTQVADLVKGVYQFELQVTDAGGLSSKDTVQVMVSEDVAVLECATNRPGASVQVRAYATGTLSKPRFGFTVVSAGNKILFAGGNSISMNGRSGGETRVDIFDIGTKTWSTAELSVPRFDITAIATGNKVFFAGGMSGEIGDASEVYHSTVDIYDVTTNTWLVTNMSEKKYSTAAASVGNKVFFVGGIGTNTVGNTTYFGHLKNKVEIYDLSTNTWSVSTIGEAKSGISAVTLNDKIYLAGGYLDGIYKFSSVIDIYNNATGGWSASTLSEPKQVPGIGIGNKIYYMGGWNGKELCKVEIKDITTQTSSFDYLSDVGALQPFLQSNKIICPRWNRKFDIFDLNTNMWSVAVLPSPTKIGPLVSVNNTIYMAGEVSVPNGNILSIEVYKLEF